MRRETGRETIECACRSDTIKVPEHESGSQEDFDPTLPFAP